MYPATYGFGNVPFDASFRAGSSRVGRFGNTTEERRIGDAGLSFPTAYVRLMQRGLWRLGVLVLGGSAVVAVAQNAANTRNPTNTQIPAQTGSAPGAPLPAAPGSNAPAAVTGGTVHGTVKAGNVPLPGVSVTATNTLTGSKYTTTTDINGTYAMAIPKNGRYVVRAEFSAFAPETKEALLNATSHDQPADFLMVLASRQNLQDQRQEGGGGSALRQLAGGAQNLNLLGAAAGLIDAGMGGGNSGAQLPSVANNSDFSNDSVAVSGQSATTSPFSGMSGDQIRQSFENQQQQQALSQIPGQSSGGGGGFGGFGGGGGGFGGFGRGGGGGGGRGFNFRNLKPNQPHGAVYWSGGNSALDAKPFAIRGQDQTQPGYSSNRFGFTLAGAPYVPKLMKAPSSKDFIFLNMSGQRSSSPYDQFGTVPTLAERAGDFSGLTNSQGQQVTIYDPATGLPYPNNTITGGFSPQAQALLAYIPAPNLPGTTQNYHRQTTEGSNTTTIGARFVHNFGPGGSNTIPAIDCTVHGRGRKQGPAPEPERQLQLQPCGQRRDQLLSEPGRQAADAPVFARRGVHAGLRQAE